ncbi:MAG: RIP metalloprotease RseP [Lachnospiraceae bacterium]|nr:RIP metalloprotease RseP [Lachnospiraceae bacterium]
MKIVWSLLIFSVVVVIHELGHFLLAKKNGICVTQFSIGMGPKLIHYKKGETEYCIKLLPFGGSCMMLGEDGVTTEDYDMSRSFQEKSVWARISVIAAGPVFNFILAFIFAIFLIGFIGYDAPIVGKVIENYPMSEAGIEPGDKIVKLNNESVKIYREVSMFMQLNGGDSLELTYERDGKRNTVTITPKYDEEAGYYLMGMVSGERIKGNALDTIRYSVYEVRWWIKYVFKSLGMLFTGQVKADELSGPVGIVNVIGETYEESSKLGTFTVVMSMLNFSILLSANLGVMNLLPFPALDGGRLVFLIIEAIRGKKIPPEKEGVVHFVGIVLLMALMVFVMINDIRRIF